MQHEAITTDEYHLSLRHYEIPPHALTLPHTVVKLHLDLSGGRLIGSGGVRRIAEQLRVGAHTLECLKLHLSCMGLCDGEFMDFCSIGLASLHALSHVNLDVSHNYKLTTVGVNAIQTALPPSVRCLELSLEDNQNIPHIELHHATGLRAVTLHIEGTHVVTLQVSNNVTDMTANLRTICHPTSSHGFIIDNRLLAGTWIHAGMRRLNLTLDAESTALLGEILTPIGPLVDLYLETEGQALSPQLWDAVRVLGTTGRLRSFHLLHCEKNNNGARIMPLPLGLSACHQLISLQLDMMFTMPSTWLGFVIRTVAHDLMNIESFHLALCSVRTDACEEIITTKNIKRRSSCDGSNSHNNTQVEKK